MIVISGALVLVALVLLVIGVAVPDLDFVYASIVVSLVSLAFLIVGIVQRRGESPAAGTAPVPVSLTEDASGQPAADQEVTAVAGVKPADSELGGTVLVVSGRPRYHIDGCRFVAGKQAEQVDVLDARDEGFTPCGVCKPDDVLAAEAAPEPAVAVAEPASVAPVSRSKAPAKVAVITPAKATKAAKPAPAKTAADPSATRRASTVVVIPDRDRYHHDDCRYVRGVEDAEVLTRAQATRQGYVACGVCKP